MSSFLELAASACEHESAGRIDEALAVARQAAAAGDRESEDTEVLIEWNYLGMLFFRAGYNDEALSAYEVAYARGAGKNPQFARALHNNLGQVMHRLGKLDEASEHLRQAVSLCEEQDPDSVTMAMALDNLGAVEHLLGRDDDASALQMRAYELFAGKLGHLSVDTATVLGNLGHVALEQGELEKAEACYLRAFATHLLKAGANSPGALLNATSLCAFYLTVQRPTEGDEFVDWLLSINPMMVKDSDRNLAETLLQLAQSTHTHHRLDLSERLLTRAQEILAVTDGANAPPTLDVRFQRAVTWKALGRLSEAENEFVELLAAYGNAGNESATLRTAIELAKILRDRGALQPARELLDQTLEKLGEDGGADSTELASALGNLGELAFKSDDYETARQYFESAVASLPDERSLDWPWLMHGRAIVEYHLGHYDEAAHMYELARARWVELHSEDHPFVATCSANLALVYWSQGEKRDALAAFEETARVRDWLYRRQLTLGTEHERLAYAQTEEGDLGKVVSFCLAAQDEAVDVFAAQMTLRRKTRVLDSLAHTFGELRADDSQEVREMLAALAKVRGLLAQLQNPLVGLGSEPDPAKLRALHAEEARLETTLSHTSARMSQGLEPVALDAVCAEIPEASVLLEYVRYRHFTPTRDGTSPWRDDRYAVFVLSRKGQPVWFDLGEVASINRAIEALRRAIPDRHAAQRELERKARKVFSLLVEPLLKAAQSFEHWIIAADGVINVVPFDVLLDEWCGLAEAPLLSYLVCGRDVLLETSENASDDVVVFADPDYDVVATEADAGTPSVAEGGLTRGRKVVRLPGTLEEAKRLQTVFPEAQVLTGGHATAAALKTLEPAPKILHVATHGVFRPLAAPRTSWSSDVVALFDQVMVLNRPQTYAQDPMMCSGLVFAGVNADQGGARCVTTARELAGLDLRGTELVVLSACETGLGHVGDGMEFSGLRRAFGVAGAQSQLTSLWPVFDEATAVFMQAFYAELTKGASRVSALRTAQLIVKDSRDRPLWRRPVSWAAFTLSGKWTPLES